MFKDYQLVFFIINAIYVCHGQIIRAQNSNNTLFSNLNRNTNCLRSDCHPETGDLLIGRTKFLYASSTCGQTQPERYCVLGATLDSTKCFVCDSSEAYDDQLNPNSHTIDNIVNRPHSDRFSRWWQSENGKQDAYIQFDLEAEFSFTHIIMTFKTFRPAAMIIEKSSNFGQTWKTHAYFAYNCEESFPNIPTTTPKMLGDVYCESKYSSETPSTKGEIVFRILPPTLAHTKDPYSNEIQDLLKITNLRVNFTKLHTFGDNLLDSREEIKEKYYYSLFEMVVRGTCLCYGHASKCIQVEGVQYDSDTNGMIHGQCQCTHNTAGTNCEQCLPLYNDREWKPARNGQTNECRRCECNNHARKCHFDASVFNETYGTSGGVCDNCEHNTLGRKCELCKENHWRDPTKPIDDVYSCKPCKCDLSGSSNDGKCDNETDTDTGLVAGRCYCKSLVEGPNCDRCQNGYFNLTKENPDGCEPCSCNLIGTTGNLGCDKVSGLCSCKINVAGRACDRCAAGYYGLSSEDPNGCKPCECSIGGSYDGKCDPLTGQCNCKPNMAGRTCDKPSTGYYCPSVSHFLYEAESAEKKDQRSQNVLRPIVSEKDAYWTGSGFVKVYEGATLEFTVNDILNAGEYDIIVRYEYSKQLWENLKITVNRKDGPPLPFGPCAQYNLTDDVKITQLPNNQDYHIIKPSTCLEPNQNYVFKFEFLQASNSQSNSARESYILLDSIILFPVIEKFKEFQGENLRQYLKDYDHHACPHAEMNPYKFLFYEPCARFYCDVGVATIGALSCECNPTGSISSLCDVYGGTCKCKTNVIGRKCDQCAANTWGFGPNGCQACNCNAGGAKNGVCNLETGACDCFDNIQGAKCDECKVNHWQFPSCIPCNCNGFADSCNQTTSECINCRENTQGYYCDTCKDGYYGRPTAGQSCKECMCPGGSTGNKFAKTCYHETKFDEVICNCDTGYVGSKCEKCAINYFGNPLEAGGSCKQCECNGNTDVNDPYSCNHETGKCSNCLYNTDGEYCELCKPGFFGNASNHECRPCNCYPDGTEDHSFTKCDQITGQCSCLPNVIGKQCDQCEKDHFGLASGEGCTECDCDVGGTYNNSTHCDQSTGKCECLPSRGDRTCNECSHGYWGNPTKKCSRCECSITGSMDDQCNKITGACTCRKGIAGYHCDRCDRGTFGQIPYCSQCGECFDDWTSIMNNLKKELDQLEEKASNLAVASSSSVKDFTAEYQQLEEKLNDVKKILQMNDTDNDRQIKTLTDGLANIEKQIAAKKESKKKFYSIERWLDDNPVKQLENSRVEYEEHKMHAEELKKEADRINELSQSGAINSILKSSTLSNAATDLAKQNDVTLNEKFEPVFKQLKMKLDEKKDLFSQNDMKIKEHFENVLRNLTKIQKEISKLNQAVCGAETFENVICNDKCGGAGCDGKCGTNTSSCSGLVDSYWNAMKVRKEFDTLYNQTESTFKRILTKWRNSSTLLTYANKEIKNLVDFANQSLKSIETKRTELNTLVDTINNFTKVNSELPNKIEADCSTTIATEHTHTDKELDDLLEKISKLAAGIDAEKIANEANSERTEAQKLLDSVERSGLYLPGLTTNLNNSQVLIETKKNKTEAIETEIVELAEDNNLIEESNSKSKENLNKIQQTLNEIEKSIQNLKSDVDYDVKDKGTELAKQQMLKAKVKESTVTLDRTKNNLVLLEKKFNELTANLQNFQNDKNSNDPELLTSIINLKSSILAKKEQINQKQMKIKKLETDYNSTQTRINNLKTVLTTLKTRSVQLQQDIIEKERYFSKCS